MPDRRGDGATATNSNAGMRSRGTKESGPPPDPAHTAKAAALLEQFKAKSKTQSFELKVGKPVPPNPLPPTSPYPLLPPTQKRCQLQNVALMQSP